MSCEIKVQCHLIIIKTGTICSLTSEAPFSEGRHIILFIARMCVCMYFEFFFVGYNAHDIRLGKAESLSFI
jgi:hypothetical protein